MLNFESEKFLALSPHAKLLLTYSSVVQKQIEFTELFFNAIGLSFPDDEMIFHNVLTEITNSKIDYKIEKIKFIPPTMAQCLEYLTQRINQKQTDITPSKAILICEKFMNFYTKKNWKVGNRKMQNWKTALVFAESWNVNVSSNSEPQKNAIDSYSSFDRLMKERQAQK